MIALSYTPAAGVDRPGMTARALFVARSPISGPAPRRPRFQAGRSVNFANFRAPADRKPS
ncbi:hypothetical protein FHT00_001629 [Sphingomonas insulae]|uniref:Uncharacterized protein n=1 Tax=Sphingomonas insulae TaxID=424800 RepID=A0ABN1HY34_9SPHN|nr:hypothetical protein [Sphingomonas insulae]NIJ29682.1 hypothetical protein [Sphingomonas insulae]